MPARDEAEKERETWASLNPERFIIVPAPCLVNGEERLRRGMETSLTWSDLLLRNIQHRM
jgi:hypothetical protein